MQQQVTVDVYNTERFSETYRYLERPTVMQPYTLCWRNTNDYEYLARLVPSSSLCDSLFKKLLKIKLYNMLPAIDFFQEDVEGDIMVTQNLREFSLARANVETLTERQLNFIAASLSITLQELCFREIPFLIDPDKVIVIDNHICLQQIDFPFNQIVKPDDSFKSYLNLTKFLKLNHNCQNFEQASNHFMALCGVELGLNENMPYVEFLEQIFEFQNVYDLAETGSNSYVYEFDTPEFMKLNPKLTARTVLKSSKLDIGDEVYLAKSAQRELEIMESFQQYEPFVSCFAYYRIQKQLYLFMERFPQDLAQALENQCIYDRHIRELCSQLAIAIKKLHDREIIHRDLKPKNIFLTHEELDMAQPLIADFDHSKTLNSAPLQTGLNGSGGYDPPESGSVNYDYKSDVWQIGMIFYQIANGGAYPIARDTLAFSQQEYQTLFTFDAIKTNLIGKPVKDDFIKVISSCLNYKSSERPDSKELLNQLIQCFGDLKIDNDDNLRSTHRSSMIESIGRMTQSISSQLSNLAN